MKKPKQIKVTCPDCKSVYVQGMPHIVFCPAHTCDECGCSYPNIVEADSTGFRKCERCLENEEMQ